MAPATSSSPVGDTAASSPIVPGTELAAIARASKHAVDWNRILVLNNREQSSASWRWVENARDFSIYTKEEHSGGANSNDKGHSFSVLAVGNIKASVGEISSLLLTRSRSDFIQKTQALYGKDFKNGEYLYDVPYEPSSRRRGDEIEPSQLSVRTALLNMGNRSGRNPLLCYLDATYDDRETGSVEKFMTTLPPQDIVSEERLAASNFAAFHDAIACYHIEPLKNRDPEEEGEDKTAKAAVLRARAKQRSVSRVYFYATIKSPASLPDVESLTLASSITSSVMKTEALEETAFRQQLLHFAKDTHCLSMLIRRRRLGMQSLVTKKRFLPLTNKPCFICGKKLLVAKVCRLCGHGVCKDCSDKYERERRSRSSNELVIESVRVCDPCLERVESADYSSITDKSLSGPAVVPDADPGTEAELGYLLRDAFSQSSTREQRHSVMNVIQCVLESEGSSIDNSSSSSPTVSVPDIHLENIPHGKAALRSPEDRTYQMDTRDLAGDLIPPISDNEDERVRAVGEVCIDRLSESVELNILCELAARELGCSMSTIAIYDRENLNIVASNVESFQKAKMPRGNTPCAHTILDTTPNLVPHPEADIRYADSWVVTRHGVKFYFAFPVVGDSDQVIGSFCVMNDESVKVTESKYTAFKKLSEACNKVVRIHSERRRKDLPHISAGEARAGMRL